MRKIGLNHLDAVVHITILNPVATAPGSVFVDPQGFWLAFTIQEFWIRVIRLCSSG